MVQHANYLEDNCLFDLAFPLPFDTPRKTCDVSGMKRLCAIFALLLLTIAFGCSDTEQQIEPEPKLIPVPEELADTEPTPQVNQAPGHLERFVELMNLPTASRPFGITLSPDGNRAYVAAASRGQVSVIDTRDLEVRVNWGPFGEHLFRTIPSQNGDRLFAFGLGGQHLHVIDTDTGRRIEKLFLGRNISDVVPGPDNTLLVASTSDKKVTIVEPESLEVRGEVTFSHPIGYIAVGSTQNIACATGGVYAHFSDGTQTKGGPVSFFDPRQTGEGEAETATVLKVGKHTRKPLFVKNDRFLLVPDRLEGTVRVFDVGWKTLAHLIDVGEGPEMIIAHPTLPEVYTINTLGRSVSVISLNSFSLIRQISLPANPEYAVISPDGKFLYVTLPSTAKIRNRIAAIDLEKRELIDLIPSGKDPCRMVLSLDGKTLFITNFMGNTVSILR